MNKRLLKIVGGLAALALVLGIGVVAGGGAVYAMTRANEPVRLTIADQPDPEPGIVIAAVEPDGPAAEAGVVRGDILLQVDGEAVDYPIDLVRVLEEHEVGDEVELTVLHGDDERTLTAVLADRDGRPYLGLVPCGGPAGAARMVTVRMAGPGTLIVDVVPDGPADQAGLEKGDVIVAVDGQELDPENDLADVIATYEPGDTVTLKVERPGEEARDVTVELGEHPEKEGVAYLGVKYRAFPPIPKLDELEGEAMPFDQPPFDEWSFPPIPGDADELRQGAVVWRVAEDSPADAAGLREGDVITAIDGEPVQSPRDLTDTVAGHKPGDWLTLTLYRPGEAEEGEAEEIELEVTLGEHPEEEGAAYLGVEIGGFFHMQRFGERGRPHGMDVFRWFSDPEIPLDELPFDPDDVPRHFEFRFSPSPFADDEVDCWGESV